MWYRGTILSPSGRRESRRTARATSLVLCSGPLLAACFPIVTSSTLDSNSRGNVPDSAATAIEVGKDSRTDVLLALGEPDGRGADDSWFSYGMTRSQSVGAVMLAPGSGGAATIVRESQTAQRLVIHFDTDGIAKTADVSTMKCAHWGQLASDCLDPAGEHIARQVDATELVQLIPSLADERVQSVFANTLWYGEVPTALGRARIKPKTSAGSLVVFSKSLVFTRVSASEFGALTNEPPPVRIPYTEVATVEVGNFVLNRWVAIHTRDGHTHYFAVLTDLKSEEIDRSLTQAAGDLLRSDLRLLVSITSAP